MAFCTKCGGEIDDDENFCKKCGNQIKSDNSHKKKEPVFIWYGLATLIGILGGIIGFLVMRKDNPPAARNCLIIGIIASIIGIIIISSIGL